MSLLKRCIPGHSYLGRLRQGGDLLEELTCACETNRIYLGRLEALGAVRQARLAFYDQDKKEYKFFEIPRHLEIAGLIGNVSLKDGRPIIHAHITLADESGNTFGGHLAQGTEIFACECCIQALEGPTFNRGYDESTGLPLWEVPEEDH